MGMTYCCSMSFPLIWRFVKFVKIVWRHGGVLSQTGKFNGGQNTRHHQESSFSQICTPRTAHDLAHPSCIAQAFKTCADELPPTAQAAENMCSSCSSYSSFWAKRASSCSSYSTPWENMCRWAILHSWSFEDMCRWAIAYWWYSSSRGKHVQLM